MKSRNDEAISLSEELLKELENKDIPISSCILRCMRLARLINDVEATEWMKYEAYGYPGVYAEKGDTIDSDKEFPHMPQGQYVNLSRSGRIKEVKKVKGQNRISCIGEPLYELEQNRELIEILTPNAPSPDTYRHNLDERRNLILVFERVRLRLYSYVSRVNNQLKFGNITEEIFIRKRHMVDVKLKDICPESIQRFTSVYENLTSNNNEDWNNALTSCRRILKDVADKLYPADEELKDDKYVARLKRYVKTKTGSDTNSELIEAEIKSIETRIQRIYEATNKGTHDDVTRNEAETYVIKTYLLIGDILAM